MIPEIKIAIAGLGNVGVGVCKLLLDNKDSIEQRTNSVIKIIAVSARDAKKDRGFDLSNIKFVFDPLDLIAEKPDIICELIGGEDGVALSLVSKALQSKIAVVTANKALLAKHGVMLAELSETHQTPLCFEAAVAGGIPIIKLLREGLAANKITKLYGILNGTCNYILTTMRDTGRDFADVLLEAQAKGYAEAEPSLDVDGFDTAHKLSLLVALAYGVKPQMEGMSVSGIRPIKADDIKAADELGYRIKLLGASHINDQGKILQIVEPCLVPVSSQLSHVNGVLNAIYSEGSHMGASFISGRGAGAEPTASSVVADIIDIILNRNNYMFMKPISSIGDINIISDNEFIGSYYLRLMVKDEAGVIADVSAILRDEDISIESLIQRGRDPHHPVMVVLTTHECSRAQLKRAIDKIKALKSVSETPFFMPILRLP
jgi:homoserine dehydrogenase